MDRGTIISGIGHASVVLWVALGDWLFAPSVPPPMQAASVSLITDAAFQALQASTPKAKPVDKPAEKPPEVVAPPPVQPDLTPVEPLPDPTPPQQPPPEAPATPTPPPELPADLPVAADPQLVEAPPPVAPLAVDEQPIPVPTADKRPKPRPIDRVAATPVDDITDTPEIADVPTPEISDQAAPDAPVVVEEAPAASPEEAAPVIVTEAVDTQPDAPQLAPTSSRRPQSRPEKVADVPVEDLLPDTSAEDQAVADAVAAAAADAQAAADAAAVEAALAEAADVPAEELAAETGVAQDLPEGPPMSGSEIEGLRLAINKCWNVGQLSSAALRITVMMRVEMSEAGKPVSIEMTGFEGGSAEDAGRAFEAGKRAVNRCSGAGYDLPPEKYAEWSVLNLEFDPSGMRQR